MYRFLKKWNGKHFVERFSQKKSSFLLPSCGCVITTVWMHQMDTYKMHREKARSGLDENAMSYFEQFLEATPNKTTAVWLLTSHIKKHPIKMNKIRETLLEKQGWIESDVLLWTPTHSRANVDWLAKPYLHKCCMDTGYSLEDLPGMIDDRDRWRERVREIHAISMSWWW